MTIRKRVHDTAFNKEVATFEVARPNNMGSDLDFVRVTDQEHTDYRLIVSRDDIPTLITDLTVAYGQMMTDADHDTLPFDASKMDKFRVDGVDYTYNGVMDARHELIQMRDAAMKQWPESIPVTVLLSHVIALLAAWPKDA